MIKGIAFDLDGTLTKPVIDFDGLRKRIGGLKPGIPIYEQALEMQEPEKSRALTILEQAEFEAAKKAEPNPGVYKLINYLEQKGIRKAIFTRNSRKSLDLTLKILKLSGKFDPVVTRELGLKLKPAPEQIFYILRDWNFAPEEVLVVGDFVFDILAGKGAGCRTILLSHNQSGFLPLFPVKGGAVLGESTPDYLISALDQVIGIVEELNGKGPTSG